MSIFWSKTQVTRVSFIACHLGQSIFYAQTRHWFQRCVCKSKLYLNSTRWLEALFWTPKISSLFVCLFDFLTSSSTTRLYRGTAPRQSVWQFYMLPHMRQSWETMTSVSAGSVLWDHQHIQVFQKWISHLEASPLKYISLLCLVSIFFFFSASALTPVTWPWHFYHGLAGVYAVSRSWHLYHMARALRRDLTVAYVPQAGRPSMNGNFRCSWGSWV